MVSSHPQSMINWQWVMTSKTTDILLQKHLLPTVPRLSREAHVPTVHPCEILTGFILCRSSAGSHTRHGLVNTVVLSCIEGSFSGLLQLWLLQSFCPIFCVVAWFLETMVRLKCPFYKTVAFIDTFCPTDDVAYMVISWIKLLMTFLFI